MGLIKIYTDGACSGNPGPAGWGVVFTGLLQISSLSGYEFYGTNNKMELTAVVEALRYIANTAHEIAPGTEIELYSDSAYVINAINEGWIYRWKENDWYKSNLRKIKNHELWDRFIKYRENIKEEGLILTFHKVKGHSGDTYNEYVDKIARDAINKARAKEAGNGV